MSTPLHTLRIHSNAITGTEHEQELATLFILKNPASNRYGILAEGET
jgi:hypothetical protein